MNGAVIRAFRQQVGFKSCFAKKEKRKVIYLNVLCSALNGSVSNLTADIAVKRAFMATDLIMEELDKRKFI